MDAPLVEVAPEGSHATAAHGSQGHCVSCRLVPPLNDRKRRDVSPATGEDSSVGFPKRQRHPKDFLQRVDVPSCTSDFPQHDSACDLPSDGLSHLGKSGRNGNPQQQFEDADECATEDAVTEQELIECIAAILENICAINNTRVNMSSAIGSPQNKYRSNSYPDGTSSIFFSLQRPAVDMRYYVARLVRYMHVSKSVFVVALIYLDRVHAADEILALTDFNVHRLITTAVSVACKYLEDEVHRNSTVCRIGGVPSLAEMNLLESQFLRRIDWDCSVSMRSYELYRSNVFKRRYSQPSLSEVSSSLCTSSHGRNGSPSFSDGQTDEQIPVETSAL
jgi:Cyclin